MKLTILLLLSACTDFTDITRSVCGNGLLEPGEDCDNEAASCVRCAVTCDAAADCPSAIYACGNDGFCHAPGGELADPSAPVQFEADEFRISDVDRDGAGDVLGVSNTSVIVRKGDAAGALSAATSFVIPQLSGPPAFGDLDGDGTVDITLPTFDGIVELTSKFGSLSPVAIESPLFNDDGTALDFVRLFQPSAIDLGGLISVDGAVSLLVASFGGPLGEIVLSASGPCEDRLGPLSKAQIDLATFELYRVTDDGASTNELVVSFLTTSGAMCVTSVQGNVAYTFVDITPVGAVVRSEKPILADLDADNDPCPGLVNSDFGAGGLRQWDGGKASGRCGLAAAGPNGALLPPMPEAPPDAVAIGRFELFPVVPGFARDALVMTSGVYGNIPTPILPTIPEPVMVEFYSSFGRRLGFVASGDIDNDGDGDAVLATTDQDDLDVLIRSQQGLQLLRIDTASRISSLTVADVDGNGADDIAYTETVSDHHDMMIAFGTVDRPLAPVQVASFAEVSAVAVMQFPDSVDTLGIADDLAVIQPGGADGGSLLAFLHGSPQRTMLSFFEPRSEAFDENIIHGIVVGDFVDAPPAIHRDLIAFGIGIDLERAWRVAGTPVGLDNTPSDGVAATLPGFRNELFAWPGADGDVVLAVDRDALRAAVIDPANFASTDAAVLVGGLTGVAIHSLHALDLDGDGARELIAAFQSPDGDDGEVRICAMSSAGTPQRCDDLTAIVAVTNPTVNACTDAAPGVISADGGPGLVVLCRTTAQTRLFRVRQRDGYEVEPLGAQAADMRAIRIGDVTGDGLDDIVATIGEAGAQSLIVFAQCSSRQIDGGCAGERGL